MIPLDLTALVLSLALAAPVEVPKPVAKTPLGTEVQDLVLLHEDVPLRLRLRITNGDQSIFSRWNDHMDRWFKFADRNRDNFIDESERTRVPSAFQMQIMLVNGQFIAARQIQPATGGTPTMQDLDLDGDGKVDRHEYLSYYASTSAGPLAVVAGYSQGYARGGNSSAVSDALFRALDADRDGRLSRAELDQVGKLLGRFDVNDDEIVSVTEIVGNQAFPGYRPPNVPGQSAAFSLNLVAVPREASATRVTARLKFAKAMLARLDVDKSGGLSATEFRIPPADFASYDANHDNQIDALELVKWVVSPPHVSILVRMEQLVTAGGAVEVEGEKVDREKPEANGLTFHLGDASFRFDRNAAPGSSRYRPTGSIKRYVTGIFNALDTKKTGRVSLEEINKNPQAVYLRNFGDWPDMNGDGFLTLEEIDQFGELTGGGAWSQVAIGFLDQGRGLFEILDTQPDAKLSIGELRNAAKPLMKYIKANQTALARSDIPRRYALQISFNTNASVMVMQTPGMGGATMRQGGVNLNPEVRRGPEWFRSMDVNGDSYISPREFLGPMAAFQRLDLDGDGLISDTEATAFVGKRQPEGRKPEPIGEVPIPR